MHRMFSFLFVCLSPFNLLSETGAEFAKARILVERLTDQLAPASDAVFSFKQSTRQLAHLRRPWHTWEREFSGVFAVADRGQSFYKVDTNGTGLQARTSYAYYGDTVLFLIDQGMKEPQQLTHADKLNYLYRCAAFTPVFLLSEFLSHADEESFLHFADSEIDTIVYRREDGNIVTLTVDATKGELTSAAVTLNHELYGDVVATFTFSDYAFSAERGFKYATNIVERKLGFDANVVRVGLAPKQKFDRDTVIGKIPPAYRLTQTVIKPDEQATHVQYKPKIHLIELKNANTRSLVVEFEDFFLVAEAPLNTKNGETILRAIEQIDSDKPIRYFVFGHYHPHYIGGVRAFVHKGAAVISTPGDSAYVKDLATFKHTLVPDSLEIQPRALDLRVMADSEMVIDDGEFEMRIINIGPMSQHTDNYLIYYFPEYKLVFVDEGFWVPSDKPLTAADPMQRGLYDAISHHKLDVATLIRGWPALDSSMKSSIEFRELKESVELIPVHGVRP